MDNHGNEFLRMSEMDELSGLMPIGADPDWVKWLASLRHRNPRTIGEKVEQLMFESILYGGEMGPNGNTYNGIDEGLFETNSFISSWTKRFDVDHETCRAVVGDGVNKVPKYWTGCSECGCVWDFFYQTGGFMGPPTYCPKCGRRVEVDG